MNAAVFVKSSRCGNASFAPSSPVLMLPGWGRAALSRMLVGQHVLLCGVARKLFRDVPPRACVKLLLDAPWRWKRAAHSLCEVIQACGRLQHERAWGRRVSLCRVECGMWTCHTRALQGLPINGTFAIQEFGSPLGCCSNEPG